MLAYLLLMLGQELVLLCLLVNSPQHLVSEDFLNGVTTKEKRKTLAKMKQISCSKK